MRGKVAGRFRSAMISIYVLHSAFLQIAESRPLPLHCKLLRDVEFLPYLLRLRGGEDQTQAEDLSVRNEQKDPQASEDNRSTPAVDVNASNPTDAAVNETETTSKKRRLETDEAAKNAATDSQLPTCMQTSNGEYYFELEAPKQYKSGAREEITQRRLTVSKYRDQTYVSIREFYAKDGQMLPGKKGR
ncbi:hypothetical protein GUITHDRAFT_133607 [Guillardia theta CCMP2712]|uniref:Transcriptional coactivator p15 (PC4) C-terminal domain-containing protein n=1 Tax=Guillardia theta (strain CCMP2712) TaxID=905079 RepID=L1JWF4_GUITC|nr:hypothetical protein GUITHDRAFT_133607 [Guillardia theta CCMP2712]EKX52535.1 hypothetical protein GUITHDRAFT_133607 [Guillardia theta CCMP2712]|eukprot:XP_005839515.1 hypothetical protein GUITHDRAFT_133607 [Guillardia theta CCMP2712]